jgi:inhibitor of KinA
VNVSFYIPLRFYAQTDEFFAGAGDSAGVPGDDLAETGLLISPAGDAACRVAFQNAPEGIDLATNRRVHALARAIEAAALEGVREAVPGYASLLVNYDPLRLSFAQLTEWLRELKLHQEWQGQAGRLVEIPVVYGGEYGPDLEFVAGRNRLSPAEVIRWHTEAEYTVYLMGFMPGFAYLGGMPPEIAAPRLASPRSRVAAGSVGIAGQQTGVYPLESPGGWRIIGRTALVLFDPLAEQSFALAPGDRVRFRAVEL